MSESRCLLCDVSAGRMKVDFLIETERIAAVPSHLEALAPGHYVFFPKQHAASLYEVSDAALAELLPAINVGGDPVRARTAGRAGGQGGRPEATMTCKHGHDHSRREVAISSKRGRKYHCPDELRRKHSGAWTESSLADAVAAGVPACGKCFRPRRAGASSGQ